MIFAYFGEVERRLKNLELIADKIMDLREFGPMEGMIIGRLLFLDGSILEFMEYLQGENRLKYRFHLMNKEGNMIFRYDNAPHHRDVSTFPHHKHLADYVEESDSKGLLEVLDEIEILMSNTITLS